MPWHPPPFFVPGSRAGRCGVSSVQNTRTIVESVRVFWTVDGVSDRWRSLEHVSVQNTRTRLKNIRVLWTLNRREST